MAGEQDKTLPDQQVRRGGSVAAWAARDAEAVVDSLASAIAIVDGSGRILAVNRAWREFGAANGQVGGLEPEGTNYLRVCDAARGQGSNGAREFAMGIRDVLAGRSPEFVQEYPCHSPDRRRWFVARVTRLPGSGPPRVVIAHEDVTGRKRSEEEIFVANAELEAQLERLDSLRQIDLAINGGVNLTLTMGIVLDQVLARLEVDAAAILLVSTRIPAVEYLVRRGYRTPAKPGRLQRLDEGPAGRAVLERRVQRVEGSTDRPVSLPDSSRDEEFLVYWSVPLVVKGHVKGVLEVGHRSPIEPEHDWHDFLEALAQQAAIGFDNAEMFEGLRRANLEISMAYDATIEGWSRAVELRDHETGGHNRRVAEMTLRLARALKIRESELVHIRRGALLHDIGKICVPDCILKKPGALTEEETAIMRRHPQHALEMLEPIAFLRPALDIPFAHHEKWDGTGYPRGLKGLQIPLAARLFAAVDVWDALCFDRPYRSRWSCEEVRKYIISLSGTHLDAGVVAVFLAILDADAIAAGAGPVDQQPSG